MDFQNGSNCKKCRRYFNLEERKPIQCQECTFLVCEDCYENNLAIEDDGAKTCIICFASSYKKIYSKELIEKMEQLGESKKYRKEQFLGMGSFVDVCSYSTKQLYAIKTFQEQPTEQDLIEVSIMKGIKSQYLCEVIEFFKTDNNEYKIVQEYAQFGDLKKYCEKTYNWNIPEHLAKEWLACVVLGLKELHSRDIIHRDIKAENILVFKEDEVRIADYGYAKTIGDPQSKKAYGTMSYISPEMLEGKSYDFSTDIYSLGITFIYLLTRTFPTKKEIRNYKWLPKVPEMSKEFIALLRKMVSYNSSDRPSIVDLMFHPSIAETKVMTDYRKVYGIMTLGFANFKPELIKQLCEQGVGCNKCSLVLCNECFRKKVQSSFLILNDMLSHANDISIRIEELVKDAKEELEVCKAVCPDIETNRFAKYTEIIDKSQKMVRHNKRNQVRRTQVLEMIKQFEPQIVETSHQVIENVEKLEVFAQIANQNAEEINPFIKAKDFSFIDLIKKVKNFFIPEQDVQNGIFREEVSENEDSDFFMDAFSTNQIKPQHYQQDLQGFQDSNLCILCENEVQSDYLLKLGKCCHHGCRKCLYSIIFENKQQDLQICWQCDIPDAQTFYQQNKKDCNNNRIEDQCLLDESFIESINGYKGAISYPYIENQRQSTKDKVQIIDNNAQIHAIKSNQKQITDVISNNNRTSNFEDMNLLYEEFEKNTEKNKNRIPEILCNRLRDSSQSNISDKEDGQQMQKELLADNEEIEEQMFSIQKSDKRVEKQAQNKDFKIMDDTCLKNQKKEKEDEEQEEINKYRLD
eukprot:403354893